VCRANINKTLGASPMSMLNHLEVIIEPEQEESKNRNVLSCLRVCVDDDDELISNAIAVATSDWLRRRKLFSLDSVLGLRLTRREVNENSLRRCLCLVPGFVGNHVIGKYFLR
jgi:hypothetical protein